MTTKNNSDLFYTCSLIEYIGRQVKQKTSKLIDLANDEEST